MRRVVFVNRYFHPDHSATSQMASDLAFHLASRGWEVEAITSRQRYDDPRANLPSGVENGVRVERIWSTRFGRAILPLRAVDYATFYLSAFFAIRKRRDAIIIAMTDPPLLSVVATLASRNVVNWTQDLFPEVAQALGIRAPRFLQRIRDWSLRRARVNVVLGELMARRVPKAVVIHNWADASLESGRPARLPGAGGTPALLVGYSGNLGRAHDVDTILAAVRMLPDVRFVFTGGGAKLDAVRGAGATNIEVRPYAPREQLSESLSSVDVHLVSLLPRLEGLIVPSKFYGVLAVARPVIFIGARDGELARIIEEHRCGIVVETADELARAIRTLEANRDEAEAMGARGRALYLARFAPERAFAEWERVLSAC
ncbi:MAG: glycosyltransferase WbuB [Acidobacteria bacterium]|nr:MAG: glycosyltransferase WbuB [Acidobacteriota bacterium]